MFFISLTQKGQEFVESLDEKANDSIGKLIAPLSIDELSEVTAAMETIKKYLSTESYD